VAEKLVRANFKIPAKYKPRFLLSVEGNVMEIAVKPPNGIAFRFNEKSLDPGHTSERLDWIEDVMMQIRKECGA
jgi:hypothetical protein